MRVTYSITKAPDNHSEYVIIIALPRQQLLREGAWILHYTYIASRVNIIGGSFEGRNMLIRCNAEMSV
jgi:hypothetical protein